MKTQPTKKNEALEEKETRGEYKTENTIKEKKE